MMKFKLIPILGIILPMIAGAYFTFYGLQQLPLRAGQLPILQYWKPFSIPDESEYFFAEPLGDELTHSILYHDLGESIDRAREADIIFIGNSRLKFGFRDDVIVAEAAKLGLKVFSLSCGFSEGHAFAMEIIRKHQLRPKILVFTGGPWFYNQRLSHVAMDAIKMTRWGAIKKRMEAVATFNLRFQLHKILPRFNVDNKRLYPGWISYRSSKTGFVKVVREPSGKVAIGLDKKTPSYRQLMGPLKMLKDELAQDNTMMLTTLVPFTKTRVRHLKEINDALNIPYILPEFSDLTSGDASHLNAESANLYASRFWDSLISHPKVRQQLLLD